MKFPQITESVDLVVGDAVIEVGRLVLDTNGPGAPLPGADPAALVVPVTGRLELDPEFVAFVERHRPAQDAVAAPTMREG